MEVNISLSPRAPLHSFCHLSKYHLSLLKALFSAGSSTPLPFHFPSIKTTARMPLSNTHLCSLPCCSIHNFVRLGRLEGLGFWFKYQWCSNVFGICGGNCSEQCASLPSSSLTSSFSSHLSPAHLLRGPCPTSPAPGLHSHFPPFLLISIFSRQWCLIELLSFSVFLQFPVVSVQSESGASQLCAFDEIMLTCFHRTVLLLFDGDTTKKGNHNAHSPLLSLTRAFTACCASLCFLHARAYPRPCVGTTSAHARVLHVPMCYHLFLFPPPFAGPCMPVSKHCVDVIFRSKPGCYDRHELLLR